MAAVEEHIQELAVLGISRPSTLPVFYRVSHDQLTQDTHIQVVGEETSGEVEACVFAVEGELLVGVASDHTDRKLEAHSVALSKQICAKPIGDVVWRFSDVKAHWDELILRSWVEENGVQVLYQEGVLSSLRTPQDLIAGFTGGQQALPDGTAMACGTVPAKGGIRPAASFSMELHDPRLNRSLRHSYSIQTLPEVA